MGHRPVFYPPGDFSIAGCKEKEIHCGNLFERSSLLKSQPPNLMSWIAVTHVPPYPRFWCLLLICLMSTWLTAGCSLLQVRHEADTIQASTILVGTISAEQADLAVPVVVAVYAKNGSERQIAHYTVLHQPGPYELIVPLGSWSLVAFADTNRDLTLQADEAAGQYAAEPVVVQHTGGVILDLNIRLGDQAQASLDFSAGTAVTARPPVFPEYTSPGIVIPLNSPRFNEANGTKGYWQPFEFFKEFGGNISFIEPYDSKKIPVLFVHGATGTPSGWQPLVAHLDPIRYQPWFYFYPSGASIKSMADLLFWKVWNLQNQYHFQELYVVAHSMGGLVVRSFLVDYGQLLPSITKFVSLSTPWSGDSLSESGVKYSPGVIPAWKDMGPESEFARSIYRKKLPPAVEYSLFFGHKGNRNPLRPNNDGVVTLASQLDPRVQAEAKLVCGFDEDHSSILTSPRVATLFTEVLDAGQHNQSAANDSPSGTLFISHTQGSSPIFPNIWADIQLSPQDKSQAGHLFFKRAVGESGTVVGPIPAGIYRVQVLASGFRAQPAEAEVVISADKPAQLKFTFVPEGSVAGFINSQFYNDGDPAGVFQMASGRELKVRSIELQGSTLQRTLQPSSDPAFDAFEQYRLGRDWAALQAFAFYGLPEGDYTLRIDAEGFEPYVEQRQVRLGQASAATFIDLIPLPR